jgi:predicted DCC family thiol-disulfide oxidoreductase YuxK
LYMYCKWPFTLYFDGACPLCAREIAFLRRHSTGGKLTLVDISANDFDAGALGFTVEQLRSCLHGRFASGHWVTGLDATLWSWRAADVGLWVAPLAWRPLRPLFSVLYRLFCRLRPRLAWLPHPDGGHRCSGEESKCHIR